MAENEIIVGIDLGTTNSCVGTWHNGSVKIIANHEGSYITPSCVSYSNNGYIVGGPAKKQLVPNPENTIYEIKRLIGKPSIDEMIEKSRRYWTFKINQDKDLRPVVEVKQGNEVKLVKPEEISAEVLKKMKETAERFTSKTVKKAIITVPAYFEQAQKQATIKAAELAGLEVPELITEPAAAAYAYGFDKRQFDKLNLLVVDLGGGTFDVVVVKVDKGIFEVAAIGGDTQLGGADFDRLLLAHIRKLIKEKYNKDCFANKRIQQKTMKEIVDLKHSLTNTTEASLYIGELYTEINEHIHINRDQFNQICDELFKKVEKITKDTLKDAGLKNTDINEVLMIGGSSRMPKVHEIMQSIFPGKQLNNSLNPDEAVAMGATVYAAQRNKTTAHEVPEMKLLEATPLALGTDVFGGLFSEVIPKNSKIPIEVTVKRATVYNKQTTMHFKIYEGVSKFACENNCLGSLKLEGITPGPATTEIVDLTFKLDANGILKVVAKHKDKKADLEIDFKEDLLNTTATGLYPDLNQLGLTSEDDDASVSRVRAKTNLCITLEKVRHIADYENIERRVKVALESICIKISEWLDKNTFASEQEFKDKYKGLCNCVVSHLGERPELQL